MQLSIQLNNLGKKYINEWIFRGLSYTIEPGQKLVILGTNGTGKSTLLQAIASFLVPTRGEVIWQNGARIADDQVYRHLSMASPYMELIEEFTLAELVEHQRRFKPFRGNMSTAEVISRMQLENAAGKYLRQFSSGMRQRVKLGLAIMAETPALLLDEPCTNLDAKAIGWYSEMIQSYAAEKTVIVCSNTVREEYAFCSTSLEIENYKS
jgi:ABC-type multidrug transport system ATPase subunit